VGVETDAKGVVVVLLILLLILLILALGGGIHAGAGLIGFSPLGIILIVVIILLLTGNL
jgi:fumarate reductase subunit C